MGSKQQQAQGFLLNGVWTREGAATAIKSPWDGAVVGTVHNANAGHLEQAITAAVAAFEVTRKLAAYERQAILRKVSENIAREKEPLAQLMAREAGKPLKAGRIEADRAALTFSLAAEESTRNHGEVLPMDVAEAGRGRFGVVRRFPIGVVAAITPFNFPLNLVAHKLAPAMAAGCPVVLKPAPQTPLMALRLAAMVLDAGWPAGALNVLPMNNDDAAALVADDRLAVLSFTGSSKVGWELKRRAGKKRVILELGGNAGVIVHSDADIGQAVERCVIGGFSYAGQSCISVQRILVQREVYDDFVGKFVERVKGLVSGDPLNEATDVGPLIREQDAVRAESWVREAEAAGAIVLCGGGRRGPMMEPTVLIRTRPEMKVNCEEVFAPVKTVEAYDRFEDALAAVNASPYGLQAGIFTRDMMRVWQAYDQLQVGGVIAGDVPTFRMDHMPYGGVKDSGMGREGVRYAIEEMTERKILVIGPR